MGGIVKSITSAVVGKRGEKRAYQAEARGIERAIGEQEGILEDITASREGLRDANIADIQDLAERSRTGYGEAFDTVGDLLQTQFDEVSALQEGAFQSNEERLLANLDDILARSQQSFDYAQENLMPYIAQGREAFQQYADKAMTGFDYEESPGYQFARDSALSAATNTAAAQGMGLSGATQKALADRAAGLAAQDYGNQYARYQSDLNTLANLGNIGLQGDQTLINREQGLGNFEVQARTALSDALSQNDFARAEALANNIVRLTGGQGELAQLAAQTMATIDAAETQGVIGQRTAARDVIDDTRSQTGSNISNLEMKAGAAEANYQRNRSALQQQLVGGVVDAGIAAAGAVAGGMGAFGGAGGLSGAMQGLNFGSEMANFGAGQTFTPQAMNFVNTGQYQQPMQMARVQPQITTMQPTNMSLGQVQPLAQATMPQGGYGLSGVGSGWLGGF